MTDAPPSLAPRISEAMIAEIGRVPYFNEGLYRTLDIRGTLDFYLKRFVLQLGRFRAVGPETVIADVGCGFGWLSIALAMATPARIVGVETDAPRLEAARRIAAILGVADRIDWRAGRLGALPMRDRESDVTYCVEVLEHTGRDPAALRDLARVTAGQIVLTTPNRLFPVIAHDTKLPFCHWLPLGLRRRYAALAGRSDRENDNLFWSAAGIGRQLHEFGIVSRFLHYRSLEDFAATFPLYIPYEGGQVRPGIGRAMMAYYRLAARFGRYSQPLLPSLAAVYERRD